MTKEEWIAAQAHYNRVLKVGTSANKRKAAHEFRLATAELMKVETGFVGRGSDDS